jgi:type II secretory pathway component PulF
MATNRPSLMSATAAAAVSVVLHGSLGLVLFIVMVLVVPRYKREFRDFQMQLPSYMELVVAVSDWLVAYGYVVALFTLPLLAVDGGIVFLSWRRQGTRILGILWIILLIVAWLLIMGVVALGLWLAHSKLLEGLSR